MAACSSRRGARSVPAKSCAYDYRLHIDGRLSKRERAQYACRCGAGKCRGSLLDKGR